MGVKAQGCWLVCLVDLGMHRACAVLYACYILIGPALFTDYGSLRSALFRAPVAMNLVHCSVQQDMFVADISAHFGSSKQLI